MSHYAGKRDNEIFVGNVDASTGIPPHLSGLKTARLGEQALDIYGAKLDPSDMLPLFIGRSEGNAYHRIMMKRTFPNQEPW